MNTSIGCGCLLVVLIASSLVDELRKPPSPIPPDLPQLSSLMIDATGQPISSRDGWFERREQIRRQWQDFLGEFPAEKCELQAGFSCQRTARWLFAPAGALSGRT